MYLVFKLNGQEKMSEANFLGSVSQWNSRVE